MPPPTAVSPDPQHPAGQFDFKFDRLGVRLPTILISSYIEPGTIIHTVLDRSSIIKTVTNRWTLPHLTERDRATNDVGEALTLDKPRTDMSEITPRIFARVPCPELEPLNDFQKGVLAIVAGVTAYNRIDEHKPIHEKVPDLVHLVENEAEAHRLKNIGEAWKFMKERLDLTFQYDS